VRIIVSNPSAEFSSNIEGLADRLANAIDVAANMAASMIEDACKADIQAAGNFGSRWTDGLHVRVDPYGTGGRQLTVVHDIPYAEIFETGGDIQGNPLLWIGISGTDAEGVPPSEYGGGGLFSIRRPSGAPLLFSISDKLPKYFGTPSVSIPQKFHFAEDVMSVMGDFQSIFDTAWGAS
jgi:hypothetical protein